MSSPGTPFLIFTNTTFDSYLKSLSKTAKKDWKYVVKHNQDLEYKEVPYNQSLVELFMNIWSQQTIHKVEPVRWAFDISFVKNLNESGVLRLFVATRDDAPIAAHFVEKYDEYVYCHPPMYDKKYNKRYLAKFMWFNLIAWATQNDTHYLDLGSGDRGSWKDLCVNRHEYPRIKYKWMYVPEKTKQSPHKEKPLYVYQSNNRKWISI